MEALQLNPTWTVTELSGRSEFLGLAKEWDTLQNNVRAPPFYRHEFIRVWLDNFAPSARWRILLGRDDGGALQAALPLVEERTWFYGLPVNQVSAAANTHSCRFDLSATEKERAAKAFFDVLSRDERWDVLRLTDVPEGGAAWAFHEAAQAAGHPVGEWESLRSPYISLPASWEALQAKLHAKFKANLRRRRKKLEEKGQVSFERYMGGEALAQKLEEGFELERSGWKGERGTAMAQDGATRGFYMELARRAALRGELMLCFLRLNGRPVAFHYALVSGGTYYLLKPGYDELLKECSPGQLLMEEVVQACISHGLKELDFLGPDMAWKRDWTDQVRVHTWLYVFRKSQLGRALREAKFRWVPRAKEMVAKWSR